MSWKEQSVSVKFSGPYLSLTHHKVIRPDGSPGIYNVWHKQPFVTIIPQVDKDHLLLTSQYRFPVQERVWEFPAGGIEPEELASEAAARELEEEAGFTASELTLLSPDLMVAPGSGSQRWSLYLATGLRKGVQHLDSTEADMIVQIFSIEQIKMMITDINSVDRIKSTPTIAAIGIYLLNQTIT